MRGVLDTSFLPPALLLIGTTVLLALLAAAEAVAIAVTRRRVRGGDFAGLASLLRAYVSERQRLRRALRFGVSAATVAATAAALTLVAGADSARAALGALAVLGGVAVVGAAARLVVQSAPETAARRLDRPAGALQLLFGPLAALLAAPVAAPLRLLGLRGGGEQEDPAEELIGMLEASAEEDAVLLEERRMMRGVLELSGQTVRELMTPRTDVTAVSTEASFGDVMKVVADSGFSRIPLYAGSLDHIVGVIYAKDLLAYVRNGSVAPRLAEIARPPYVVPETKRANDLLADLRRDKVHMAIAVDEYGGTAGVLTVEDLVEEIVGAIADEYDTVDTDVQQISPNEAIVDASLTVDELNDLFDTEIVPDNFDTVGGLIVTALGRLAVPGDAVIEPRLEEHAGRTQLELQVLTILGRRIKKVRVQRHVPAPEAAEAAIEPV
ncbi:MAG: HlyC/CorC family transporter [Dehalococcoidia bacterium]|nr:HlyC/CorC family transporter [Dehalococcoidia bacterium]